ncbi:MAG TPA: hypothetical protein VKY89_09030 [Thermoanaerobaculia bacterium]|jgi:hypothetical protein|nr:hypothetical protein [Thermoanaerobaculia bacterium]
MRSDAEEPERRWIVRHLIAGCSRCLAVTSRLWSLGDPLAAPGLEELDERPEIRPAGAQRPAATSSTRRRSAASRSAAAYGKLFEQLTDAGRRIEEERELGPRLAAELLASPPATQAALRSPDAAGAAGQRFLTPAVCDALLDRSREAAAAQPGLALQAAELALAIADRLDVTLCGVTVALASRVRAWAHVGQARRLGGDLDGAEWALAVADALLAKRSGRAAAAGDPHGTLTPAEWAELLVFKAGLFADRGDAGGADRLLGRAAEIFLAAAEPHRAGRTLVQQGLIRADLGDRDRAAKLLRAGVDLLDPVAEPGLVAVNLYRLATLLRGIAMEQTAAAAPHGPHDPAEALRLVERARGLYRGLGDTAAEAHLWRLKGQIEASLGRLENAEATLVAAVAALAQHGLGREAALAQIELAQVLVRQGRAGELHQLGLDHWPQIQARDLSWEWYAAVLQFHCEAAHQPLRATAPQMIGLLDQLARYLAPRQPRLPAQQRTPSLSRVA